MCLWRRLAVLLVLILAADVLHDAPVFLLEASAKLSVGCVSEQKKIQNEIRHGHLFGLQSRLQVWSAGLVDREFANR